MDRRKVFRKVLPLLIILGCAGVAVALIALRPAPKKTVRENAGTLVNVVDAQITDHQVMVSGTGTVQAEQETAIVPQVSGKVTSISPRFVAGGFFNRGELLFSIEKVDYELNVERAKAAMAQAELDLAREESNARIARDEWERLKAGTGEEPNPLVVYEPQLKRAKAGVSSAEAALKQAEIELERTRLYAPYNGRIRSETIDIGQYVRAGTGVGIIAGTDEAEIIVPVSLEQLQWISIPRNGAKVQGSMAMVKVKSGDNSFTWNGRVVRSLGEMDDRARMARVVVAVDDPYGLKRKRKKEEPDLAVGMFVEVDIIGQGITGVVLLPREALREGDTVWTVDDQGELKMKPVTVLRKEKENVIIQSGLAAGERVVLTTIPGASEGIKLRVLGEEHSQ